MPAAPLLRLCRARRSPRCAPRRPLQDHLASPRHARKRALRRCVPRREILTSHDAPLANVRRRRSVVHCCRPIAPRELTRDGDDAGVSSERERTRCARRKRPRAPGRGARRRRRRRCHYWGGRQRRTPHLHVSPARCSCAAESAPRPDHCRGYRLWSERECAFFSPPSLLSLSPSSSLCLESNLFPLSGLASPPWRTRLLLLLTRALLSPRSTLRLPPSRCHARSSPRGSLFVSPWTATSRQRCWSAGRSARTSPSSASGLSTKRDCSASRRHRHRSRRRWTAPLRCAACSLVPRRRCSTGGARGRV